MPTKPTPQGGRTIGSQKDRRYGDTFYDQHRSARFPNGRPWNGEREFLSGSENPSSLDPFVQGELHKGDSTQPGLEWDAPWVPEWNGGRNAFYEFIWASRRIRVRYDRVIAVDRQGQDEYYMAAAKLAAASGWREVEYGSPPPYQVTAIVGTPPRSPKIAMAAQAGDPWLLGFVEEPNVELAKLLGITTSGMRIPQPAAKIEPAQILAVQSDADLIKLVANVVTATLDARDADRLAKKQAADNAKMAKVRARRGFERPAQAETPAA